MPFASVLYAWARHKVHVCLGIARIECTRAGLQGPPFVLSSVPHSRRPRPQGSRSSLSGQSALGIQCFCAYDVYYLHGQSRPTRPSPRRAESLGVPIPNQVAKSLQLPRNRGLSRHLVLPAGQQLGSFRNLPPAGNLERRVVGHPSQAGCSPAVGPPEKGGRARLSRSEVSRQVPDSPAGRGFGPEKQWLAQRWPRPALGRSR
jgi:hypothetical protein